MERFQNEASPNRWLAEIQFSFTTTCCAKGRFRDPNTILVHGMRVVSFPPFINRLSSMNHMRSVMTTLGSAGDVNKSKGRWTNGVRIRGVLIITACSIQDVDSRAFALTFRRRKMRRCVRQSLKFLRCVHGFNVFASANDRDFLLPWNLIFDIILHQWKKQKLYHAENNGGIFYFFSYLTAVHFIYSSQLKGIISIEKI